MGFKVIYTNTVQYNNRNVIYFYMDDTVKNITAKGLQTARSKNCR